MKLNKTWLPDLNRPGMKFEEKIQAINEYLISFEKQIRHVLCNIDEDNFSGTVIKAQSDAAGRIEALEKNGNGKRGDSDSGASEIITLTQAEFDALSQTDIANYHANGVRTILVKGVSESGEPVFMRLDVAMQLSDEQKKNVVESLGLDERYGGLKMELLWENATPRSSFFAQTISIDLLKAEFALIEYAIAVDSKRTTVMLRKNSDSVLMYTGRTYTCERSVSLSDNALTFGVGKKGTPSEPYTDDNTRIIPTRIYSIKGVS